MSEQQRRKGGIKIVKGISMEPVYWQALASLAAEDGEDNSSAQARRMIHREMTARRGPLWMEELATRRNGAGVEAVPA